MSTAPYGQIEADHDLVNDDHDSLADTDSLRDSTASITSSILEYRTIHGRTYQSSSTTEYWAPNDNKHVEAFDVAHQWLTLMMDDQLYRPPIGDNPKRILDVGTGTGIWAIDMADTFPNAEVIGTDITPTQPSWVPPNVRFQIDDAQLDWTFQDNSFDFIHVRYMHGAINDWNKFYQQMYRCLKPGGWFMHTEPNIELREGRPGVDMSDEKHVFNVWAKLFYDVGDKLGREFRFDGERMKGYSDQAGFVNFTHEKYILPLNTWPKDKRLKEIGVFTSLYMDLSLDGFAIFPIGQVLGWTLEEVNVLVAKMRAVLKDPKSRANSDMHCTYGQKPLDAASSYDAAAAAPAPAAPAAAPAPAAETPAAPAAAAEPAAAAAPAEASATEPAKDAPVASAAAEAPAATETAKEETAAPAAATEEAAKKE